MYEWLKKRDRAIADRTADDTTYFELSPTRISLTRVLFPLAEKNLRGGRCLDAGAGRMAYAQVLRPWVDEYISMDITFREGIDIMASAIEMPWRDQSFDRLFCSQVLEHVPDPQRALQESFRCLKPGGVILISVPHLSYLHNEPNDYYRFTHHGLRTLLTNAGFSEIEIHAAGGLLSFLGHIPSVLMKSLFFSIPVLGTMMFFINRYYSRFISWLDERVERKKIYALNYVAVARKPKS